MARTVGIVGAGIAGLVTAKVLKQFGFRVTVFEKEPDVGGVWAASRRYPGLTTQNPKETYEFSDFPMPSSYPEWPSGAQMQTYLSDYALRFQLGQYLRLNTEVRRAWYEQATNQWLVETKRSDGLDDNIDNTSFDVLVVANGIFSEPALPRFRGAEDFLAGGGRILHTSQFLDLESVRGKHVVVVGYGKSSCDAACALVGVAASVQVVVRSLIWKIPKRIMNRLNFKYLFLTRMGEALFRYIRIRGFEKFLHGHGLPIRNAILNSVQGIVARQLDLQAVGLLPQKPIETIARSTVSLVTDGFYESVRAERLKVHAPDSIAELSHSAAKLNSGAMIRADLVICGTGWQQQVPFFDAAIRAKICDAQGNFRLYRSMIPVDVPALVFNGYNSSFFSQLNAEIGALWLADYLCGGIQLPEAGSMNADIDARLAWAEARTDGKHAKGTNIIPFSVHHMDELLADIDLTLDILVRFRQWLVPVVGSHYRSLTPKLLKRYEIRAAADGHLPADG